MSEDNSGNQSSPSAVGSGGYLRLSRLRGEHFYLLNYLSGLSISPNLRIFWKKTGLFCRLFSANQDSVVTCPNNIRLPLFLFREEANFTIRTTLPSWSSSSLISGDWECLRERISLWWAERVIPSIHSTLCCPSQWSFCLDDISHRL